MQMIYNGGMRSSRPTIYLYQQKNPSQTIRVFSYSLGKLRRRIAAVRDLLRDFIRQAVVDNARLQCDAVNCGKLKTVTNA